MTRDPGHHLIDALRDGAGRDRRAVDHDDRQAKDPCRVDLGARTLATGILGDDMGNGMVAHQRQIVVQREGPTGNDGMGIGQRQGLGRRIDQPQKIMVLGLVREIGEVHPADGEEDAGRRIGQGAGGGGDVGDVRPGIARPGLPGIAFQRHKRRSRHRRGQDGIRAHLRGEGMGRVDQMGDGLIAQVTRQPLRPAEAADAGGQGLRARRLGSARVGQGGVNACLCQGAGKAGGIGGAAQKKDACHG